MDQVTCRLLFLPLLGKLHRQQCWANPCTLDAPGIVLVDVIPSFGEGGDDCSSVVWSIICGLECLAQAGAWKSLPWLPAESTDVFACLRSGNWTQCQRARNHTFHRGCNAKLWSDAVYCCAVLAGDHGRGRSQQQVCYHEFHSNLLSWLMPRCPAHRSSWAAPLTIIHNAAPKGAWTSLSSMLQPFKRSIT